MSKTKNTFKIRIRQSKTLITKRTVKLIGRMHIDAFRWGMSVSQVNQKVPIGLKFILTCNARQNLVLIKICLKRFPVDDFKTMCDNLNVLRSIRSFFLAIYIVVQRTIHRGSDGRVYSTDWNTFQTKTICSYNWDNHDATVVCKELALGTYGTATYIPRNYTYERSMFNVQCLGNETSIFNCTHDTYDYSLMCASMSDAGVNCSYDSYNSRYSNDG